MRLSVCTLPSEGAHSMRIAGSARGVYTLCPMRIAFGGRPVYAHSRGVEGVAPEGADL